MPGASIWIAVAEVLAKGLSVLPDSTRIAVVIGALVGILIEFLNRRSQGRFPISAMGLGLSFVLKFSDGWAMAAGSLFFWFMSRHFGERTDSKMSAIFRDNQETLFAGVIAGGTIMGIVLIIMETIVLA
jgi:hypothetical protein